MVAGNSVQVTDSLIRYSLVASRSQSAAKGSWLVSTLDSS